MTLREAQALIILYQACRDEALRLRVLKLVPELGEFEQQFITVDLNSGVITTTPRLAGVALNVVGTKHCP